MFFTGFNKRSDSMGNSRPGKARTVSVVSQEKLDSSRVLKISVTPRNKDCLCTDQRGQIVQLGNYVFCAPDDQFDRCEFVTFAFRIPSFSAPMLTWEELVRWAVRILGHDVAKTLTPHQAVDIRIFPPTTGVKTRQALAENSARKDTFGPQTPERDRQIFERMESGESLQIGDVKLLRDEKHFTFSERVFSFQLAAEFAAYILRDVAARKVDERYYVPWLIVRPADHWSGTKLSPSAPQEFTLAEDAPVNSGTSLAEQPSNASNLKELVEVGESTELPKTAEAVLELLCMLEDMLGGMADSPEMTAFSGEILAFRPMLRLLKNRMDTSGIEADGTLFGKSQLLRLEAELEKRRRAARESVEEHFNARRREFEVREEALKKAQQTLEAERDELHAANRRERAELDKDRKSIDEMLNEIASEQEKLTQERKELGELARTLAGDMSRFLRELPKRNLTAPARKPWQAQIAG